MIILTLDFATRYMVILILQKFLNRNFGDDHFFILEYRTSDVFFKPIKSTTFFDASPKIWVILGRIISETSEKKKKISGFVTFLFDMMEGDGNLDGKYIGFFLKLSKASQLQKTIYQPPAYDFIG